jgi:hypothetical protein
MEQYLFLGLRNALAFCILLTAITLFPSPFLYIQRAFLRMRGGIQAWRHAIENPFGARGPKFWEIDMTKFDALENDRLRANR